MPASNFGDRLRVESESPEFVLTSLQTKFPVEGVLKHLAHITVVELNLCSNFQSLSTIVDVVILNSIFADVESRQNGCRTVAQRNGDLNNSKT